MKKKENKIQIYKKRNKFAEWVNKKGKWVILSTLIFILVGLICLVVGFGIADGWDAVLAWFGSRYAVMIYVIVALLIFGIVWFIHKAKMEK